MNYSYRQKEYIDRVQTAHSIAIEIIGQLEKELGETKQRAWRAESRADEKWGLRKEIAAALGVSDKCDDEALRAGLAAIRRLENERDDALARLDQYEERNPVYPDSLGRWPSNQGVLRSPLGGDKEQPVVGISNSEEK